MKQINVSPKNNKTNMKTKTLLITMDEKLHYDLKFTSFALKESMNEIICNMIKDYVISHKAEVNEIIFKK